VKKEFAGTLQTSFGMMGTVHLCLEMPGFLGDTNQFLEGAKGKRVLVTVETQELEA
jgi:hypothetical protein